MASVDPTRGDTVGLRLLGEWRALTRIDREPRRLWRRARGRRRFRRSRHRRDRRDRRRRRPREHRRLPDRASGREPRRAPEYRRSPERRRRADRQRANFRRRGLRWRARALPRSRQDVDRLATPRRRRRRQLSAANGRLRKGPLRGARLAASHVARWKDVDDAREERGTMDGRRALRQRDVRRGRRLRRVDLLDSTASPGLRAVAA